MNCKQEYCGVSYSKPILIDVYCGAGGATRGYQEAGFEVIGVDVDPQPEYVGDQFVQMDALEFLDRLRYTLHLDTVVAAIHASPPCQRYSQMLHGKPELQEKHPDLIEPTREALIKTGRPYVIENVEGAPLLEAVTLCGSMEIFHELRVLRHRQFETNWELPQPEHPATHPLVVTMDKRKSHYGKLDPDKDYVGVYGGGQGCSVAQARDAMGIDWMNKAHLNEAIPPAFTKYVGEHLYTLI
ncbi:MAG: DNA cytosine methyltransferase [Actinobacteria bacterium]|nr:DNA cytosine methyltransferase [Actinomycetota bacterium]